MTIIGATYAAFVFSKAGTVENVVKKGAVTMIYTEGENKITINNAMPISDEVGKTLSDENYIFDFTININIVGNATISYEVTAEKDSSSTLTNDEVRLYLQKSLDGTNYDDEVLEPSPYIPLKADDEFGAKAGEMVMDVGSTNKTVIYYYRLRMWVDENFKVSEVAKKFTIRVNAYGKDEGYKEKSNPNPPELVGDMIPVVYDETSGSWQKSSTSKGTWYNYDNQKWANVVTIKDSTKREMYKNASVGTPIAIEDINTFLVWIPRYSYTLGNTYGYQIEGAETPSLKTPGAFDIKFIKKDKIDTGSGEYTGDTPENYFTPSSFCWGDTCDDEETRKDSGNIELSGIWVAKFELTGAMDDISSIPNVTSLRQKTVSQFFTGIETVMNGASGLENYGFDENYDTHLIKNTEWGAFTYLSQSKYGKYGNPNYSGADKEIYLNESSDLITGSSNGAPYGRASDSESTYNIEGSGTGASTTGTIYGIYDISGGAKEYVMANYNNTIGSSGFNSIPSRKYYNLYTESKGIKGDATNSASAAGFYGYTQTFPTPTIPWVIRGGFINGSRGSGAFVIYANTGTGWNVAGTRIALVNAK